MIRIDLYTNSLAQQSGTPFFTRDVTVYSQGEIQ